MVGFTRLAGLVAATACALGSLSVAPDALADPSATALINSLPGGFGPDNCKTFNSPFAGAVEAVTCGQNDDLTGPGGGQFFRFDNIHDLAAAYKALLDGTTTAPCNANTPAGSSGWNYSATPNQTAGDAFCGNDKKNPSLAVETWTLNSQFELGSIGGADIPSLDNYWNSNGFPDPAAPTASNAKIGGLASVLR